MNNNELDLVLDRLVAERKRHAPPPTLHNKVRAIPTTTPLERGRLPRFDSWTLRSMFSATKFVVAGVIVALFGGFLLIGVLTQPSYESAPAVGASASSSTEGEPRASLAARQPLTTEQLLATVDATEVGSGIFRIDDDGIREPREATDAHVTNDGQVWVMTSLNPRQERTDRRSRLYSLGQGELPTPPTGAETFHMRDDGTIVSAGQEISWFDGETWRTTPSVGSATAVHRTSDGTIWAQLAEMDRTHRGADRALGRYDGKVWSFSRSWDPYAQGSEPKGDVRHFAESPDGTLFAGETSIGGHIGPGALQLDGDTWYGIEPPELYANAEELHATAVAVGPGGELWATLWGHDHDSVEGIEIGAHLGRWDGQQWELFDRGRINALVGLTVDPAGSVWGVVQALSGEAPAIARFDGHRWTEIAVPQRMRRLTASHDGSIWAVGDNGRLYVITPDATAATQ